MPITLARIGQSGQCECANTLFLDGMDEEIKNGWDEAAVQKVVGSIKEQSGVTSSIFNCRYSVFFWHLLLLE
jgi:hypothetical protein